MRGEGGSFGVSANENSCADHGAQINFGDLPPYLAYGYKCLISGLWSRAVRVSWLRVPAPGLQRSRAEYAAVRRAAQHRRTHGRSYVHRRCALPSRLHCPQYPGNAPPRFIHRTPKKSRAPRKVEILCKGPFESLKWPHFVIFKGFIS
jgi:hypothetical protein